jgi:polygalacturonase
MFYLSTTLVALALAVSKAQAACTGTIASMSDVTAAVACTTINMKSFGVPSGQTLNLNLLAGTTVNMRASSILILRFFA